MRLVELAIRLARGSVRRTGKFPTAFLINPEDDRGLGAEMRWLRPQTAVVMPEILEPTHKYIKGIAVYLDPRVPRGHVAALK